MPRESLAWVCSSGCRWVCRPGTRRTQKEKRKRLLEREDKEKVLFLSFFSRRRVDAPEAMGLPTGPSSPGPGMGPGFGMPPPMPPPHGMPPMGMMGPMGRELSIAKKDARLVLTLQLSSAHHLFSQGQG